MTTFEFSGVSEVRRWDRDSDDPRVRKVVEALDAVPRGIDAEGVRSGERRTEE
jgi:hypothetical protein